MNLESVATDSNVLKIAVASAKTESMDLANFGVGAKAVTGKIPSPNVSFRLENMQPIHIFTPKMVCIQHSDALLKQISVEEAQH